MLPSNYAYASGKIRALEPMILNATDIERMVDAPDFNTAFKVLDDTDYADNLLAVEPLNYRDALRDDYSQLHQLLKKLIPDQKVFNILYLDRDFLNIKLLLKAKFFNLETGSLPSHDTIYPPEKLKEFIFNNKDLGLDPEILQIITNSINQIKKRTEPHFIDTLLTQKYFALIQQIAKKIGNRFIADLIKIQVDNANLLSWLRAKRLKLKKNQVSELFIAGGNINPSLLLSIYADEPKNLKPIVYLHYDKMVTSSFDTYLENNSLFEFEKALEDFETQFCQKAKMVAYGPEIVVAYYIAKRIAVKNVRLIMTGKLNRVPAEEIKKTLREVY